MTEFQSFNLLDCPLSGSSVIEASAGTGKTYSISGLYLRLVVEKGISIDRILVVTFTQAATEELRTRIREQIRRAYKALGEEDTALDSFLTEFVARIDDRARARDRLLQALHQFDEAAIFTIHGFCRRVLKEYAFESNALLDTKLVTQDDELVRQSVADFWRSRLYRESRLFISYLQTKNVTLETFVALQKRSQTGHVRQVVPDDITEVDCSGQEKDFERTYKALQGPWKEESDEILEEVLQSGLSKNVYRDSAIAAWCHGLNSYLCGNAPRFPLPPKFEKFTATAFQKPKAVRKGEQPPRHSFFAACDAHHQAGVSLQERFDRHLVSLKCSFLKDMQKRLPALKQVLNVQSFDDLLTAVYAATQGPRAPRFCRGVRARYDTALIDEFQDTDPLQYAIFHRLFGNHGCFFVIGDPKQSIYSFRGADVFAYLEARKAARATYGLIYNWRSDPRLIDAVNVLFGRGTDPFVVGGIDYLPVQAAQKPQTLSLTPTETTAPQPLQVWFMPRENDKPLSAALAEKRSAEATVGEIWRLLGNAGGKAAVLGNRVLCPGDIAVLVRRKVQALLMQESLGRAGIPSVVTSNANLFVSHEAAELQRFLTAVMEPGDTSRVNAALCTDLCGIDAHRMAAFQENESGYEEWLAEFYRLHALWRDEGVMRMLGSFFRARHVRARLLGYPNGQRRITNVLHLAELLHREEVDTRRGMEGLCTWLGQRRAGMGSAEDEHELRLEQDDDAVRIITVHRSKGLEFPVVFVPFPWTGSGGRSEEFVFHDPEHNRATLDIGSANRDQNKSVAQDEELAEDVRLLYVALTRAKYRCYMAWGYVRNCEISAPAYVLHRPECVSGYKSIGTAAAFESRTDDSLLEDLRMIASRAPDAIGVSELPPKPETRGAARPADQHQFAARTFRGTIDRTWAVSSFSSLASSAGFHESAANRDQETIAGFNDRSGAGPATTDEAPTIFSFPKGVTAGNFFHELLEKMDFTRGDDQVTATMIRELLRRYGLSPEWESVVLGTMRNVLGCALPYEDKHVRLKTIGGDKRVSELQFHFPVHRADKTLMTKAIMTGRTSSGGLESRLSQLRLDSLRGYMHGFVDLIFEHDGRFFVVDWKSNFLGAAPEYYTKETLQEVMHKELYVLQYYIYLVALDRYLRLRIPDYSYESHVGGVFYLFIRGMRENGSTGVFFDRPAVSSIHMLQRALGEEVGE